MLNQLIQNLKSIQTVIIQCSSKNKGVYLMHIRTLLSLLHTNIVSFRKKYHNSEQINQLFDTKSYKSTCEIILKLNVIISELSNKFLNTEFLDDNSLPTENSVVFMDSVHENSRSRSRSNSNKVGTNIDISLVRELECDPKLMLHNKNIRIFKQVMKNLHYDVSRLENYYNMLYIDDRLLEKFKCEDLKFMYNKLKSLKTLE